MPRSSAAIIIALAFIGCDSVGSTGGLTPATDTTSPTDSSPSADAAIPDGVAPSGVDPCGGVPVTGRCNGPQVELCVVGTGSNDPFIATIPCGAGLTCGQTPGGAGCVLSGQCRPGDSECRGNSLAQCVDGSWQTTSCGSGCVQSALGASCRSDITTITYSNSLEFEYRAANANLTDWGNEVFRAPGRGLFVLSFANGQPLDATVTDENGNFTLQAVPGHLEDGDDYIAIIAASPIDDTFAYAIVAPGTPPGQEDLNARLTTGFPNAAILFWTVSTAVIPSGDGVYLPISSGSGAAFAYDYLRAVHEFTRSFYGARPNTSLVMWLGFGTSWSCGACFASLPTSVSGVDFSSQIFIPAVADEAYWGGPLLAHELGHWVMATYGVSPGEGGPHIIGIPSHPGLAWSEGFATWFSAVARGQSVSYDKQQGLFFWMDIGSRSYSLGQPWMRPQAQFGLEQLLDENEVAHMLWRLTNETTFPGMMASLSAPRMMVSPFLRGYLRRVWNGLDQDGWPLPAWQTDVTAPHFADFLDALQCHGVHAANTIDTVTEPFIHYPYPSRAPLCRHGELPIQVSWRTTDTDTIAEVRWHWALEEDLELEFRPGPSTPTLIPAQTPPGSITLRYLAGESGSLDPASQLAPGAPLRPEGLAVSTRGASWGVAGLSPYRPTAHAIPARDGPHLRFGRHDLGRSIQVPPRPTTPAPLRPIRHALDRQRAP